MYVVYFYQAQFPASYFLHSAWGTPGILVRVKKASHSKLIETILSCCRHFSWWTCPNVQIVWQLKKWLKKMWRILIKRQCIQLTLPKTFSICFKFVFKVNNVSINWNILTVVFHWSSILLNENSFQSNK